MFTEDVKSKRNRVDTFAENLKISAHVQFRAPPLGGSLVISSDLFVVVGFVKLPFKTRLNAIPRYPDVNLHQSEAFKR